MTPWELKQWLEARVRVLNEDRRDEAVVEAKLVLATAWYTEYYRRYRKRLPKLEAEMRRISGKGGGGRLSPEASAEALRSWAGAVNAAMEKKE